VTGRRSRERSLRVQDPAVTPATRRGLRARVVERWTPLFPDAAATEPLTAGEFAAACGWPDLVAAGTVAADEDPLALAGLRLSSIFPRHLLRRRDDGRLVPVAVDDAVALVRLTLAQRGRGDTPADAAHPLDAAADDADVGANLEAGAAEHSDAPTDDGQPGGERRRFFRRH